MKMLKNFIILIILFFLFAGCEQENKQPEIQPPVLRDYTTQYNDEIIKIENYLKTHSVSVIDNQGFTDDQKATFTIVPSLDPNSIWGSDFANPKSSLLTKLATRNNVVHKIYYIKFRNGIGASPNINSRIRVFYNGFLLNNLNTVFDASVDQGTVLSLNELIYGWREVLPEFKMGNILNVNQYTNFGAGAMFVPSAFGYYEKVSDDIPAYSPLIYTFKLFNVI